MNRRDFLRTVGASALMAGCRSTRKDLGVGSGCSIVYLLADDLGYGDVAALNPEGKIPTPHMDRLAAEGTTFTDCHSGSAVCTPTRYGILTGRYCWRTRLASGVLGGYSAPLIDPDRMTVASLLRDHGYRTACVGKWHLGWDWPFTSDSIDPEQWEQAPDAIDFTRPIANGPTTRGFDRFFGIAGSLDMAPYVFIDDDRPSAVPEGEVEASGGMQFYRRGPVAPDFTHEGVLDRLTDEAVRYIEDQSPRRPFFLYFPLSAPHKPILPTPAFQGKSGLNPWGDFVMQVDATVGRVLDAIDRMGLRDNTLVIMTSDNGATPGADFDALARKGHDPSYIFRGLKADIFEGGHRVPFIARWPGRVAAGATCGETICLTDLLATAADLAGAHLPDNAGEDSVSLLPVLTGSPRENPLRQAVVHHSINGSFAIRQGRWKLELCPGSGGWSEPRPGTGAAKALPPVQLYDLNADIEETTNLQDQHPEVVARLTALLEHYVEQGRSTPGPPQPNDRDIAITRGG